MPYNMPKCWKKSSKPHLFCPGCGHAIALKQIGYAIDDLGIQRNTTLGIDIGCSLLVWNFFDIDTLQTHHGRTTPAMVGYKLTRPNRVAIGYVGDGGGYAIGLQSLLHAAYRNNPVTIVLINNENYAMTGGQMAPTTEVGVVTSTTPLGKPLEFGAGLHGPELVRKVASPSAFIARVSINNPESIRSTIKKAISNQMDNNAFSFVEILSICPTNWKTNAAKSFERLRAIESTYALGEIGTEVPNAAK